MANDDFLLHSTGWAFPVDIDIYGGIKMSKDEQNIRESIKIILETSMGEMVTNERFGCKLNTLMFSPINNSTIHLAEDYVAGALRRWEPRISLRNVKGVKNPDVETGIDLEITYESDYSSNNKTTYQFNTEGEEK